MEISAFCGNIHVSWIYPHFVDTVGILQVTSYLDRHVCHFIHSFVLVVDIVFGHAANYLARNVRLISHILLI